MAANASTVRINFLGDSRSLSRATTQARGEVDKFQKSMGGIKKAVGGLALLGGGAAAFSFAKGLISDAAESAKVTRLTENVIRSTGKAAKVSASQVAALSQAISNKTGVDDEAIQSGQNLLLTFTNIKNVGADKIFDQASQAAVDMTAAMNNGDVSAEKIKGSALQLGKALNDPVKGITALTRSGVSFTEQQKAQIKAMVKAGDTAGAQKIILGELKKEFGGAAAAASSPAQRAAVAWGNLREQMGAELLPIVSKVATVLSSKVIPAVSRFIENIKSGGGGFASFRAGMAKAFEFIRGDVLPLLQRLGTWITTVGWPAVKRFAAAFWQNLQPALAQLKQTYQSQLRPALENLIAKFKESWPTIQRVLTILGQLAGVIMTKVVPVLVRLWGKELAAVIRVLGVVWAAAWKVVGIWINVAAEVGKAGAAFGRFVGKVGTAIGDFKKTVSDGIGKVIGFYKELPQKIVNAIGDVGGKLVQKGKDLIAGFGRGAEEQAKKLPFGMGKVVGWAIDGIQKAQRSNSPAKVTMPLGKDFVDGYAKGIGDNAKKVSEAVQAMVDRARDKLAEVKSFAGDIRAMFRDLGNVTGIDNGLEDGGNGGFTGLLDGLRKKAADAQKFAKAMKSLRKAGLNQTTLDQLREAGPDGGLGAAQNLLSGGMGGVGEVNRLMSEINRVGKSFAEGEAKRKFGIGPDATNMTGREVKVLIDITGGDDQLTKWLRGRIRAEGGNVQKVLGK